jgi:hypothetical protein
VVGKITQNPELVQVGIFFLAVRHCRLKYTVLQHGHDRKTGNLKRSAQEQVWQYILHPLQPTHHSPSQESDPFAVGSPPPGTTTSPSTRTQPNEDATSRTTSYFGPNGGKSVDVDHVRGDSRLTTDPSQRASRNGDITQSEEV